MQHHSITIERKERLEKRVREAKRSIKYYKKRRQRAQAHEVAILQERGEFLDDASTHMLVRSSQL